MNYNIHPIIVHFPIALLTIYSLIKILPVRKWFSTFAWRDIEVVLLVLGVLGAMAANSTGEIAEHLVRPPHKLVETHAAFASVTTWMYGLLLTGEILAWLKAKFYNNLKFIEYQKYINPIVKILQNKFIVLVLALVGLFAVFVTGLLGGVIVYGVTADPIAPFVLKLLNISI
ncbi:MAG: DUF2231 domain-containing protein [Candidatus Paceibacterota bacterium]